GNAVPQQRGEPLVLRDATLGAQLRPVDADVIFRHVQTSNIGIMHPGPERLNTGGVRKRCTPARIDQIRTILNNDVQFQGSRPMTAKERMRPTSRHIRSAALKLFVAKGSTQLTVSELATAAGVARGTIYNQLGDGSELFEEVAEHLVQEMSERLSGIYQDIDDRPRAWPSASGITCGAPTRSRIGGGSLSASLTPAVRCSAFGPAGRARTSGSACSAGGIPFGAAK